MTSEYKKQMDSDSTGCYSRLVRECSCRGVQHRPASRQWPAGVALMVLLLGLSPTSFAGTDANGKQDTGQLKISRSRITGLTSFVTARDRQSAIPVAPAAGRTRLEAGDFFTHHGRLFGVTHPITQLLGDGVRTDRFGWTHTSFQQVHKGLEVFGGVLRVHQKPDGSIYAVNGDFYPISPKLKTTPVLTAEAAVRNARQS